MKNPKLSHLFASPLLHFLLVGLLVFLSSSYIAKRRDAHKIIIDKAVIEKLTLSWETQFGSPPTDHDLKMAANDYIKQEVLYREAESLGLNKDDEIIKRRLQQKMAFILKDNIIVPDPGKTELESYYKMNAARFSESPRVSFSHIYFSTDHGGAEQAKERATAVLKSLEMKPGVQRAPELGDRYMFLYDYNNINKTEAGGLFGDSPFSDSLFTIKVKQWAGPFLSGYGWHLLYVNVRTTGSIPPLSAIKDRVIDSYKNDKLNQLDNAAIEKLIGKYTVELKAE
ncbi:MAG TPA: peptidylprolyl isomerase [Puia sp.]|nr:peptidylprolyl isomerase [Puia sp.]